MNAISMKSNRNEYERVTQGHPWERGTGRREILNCPNCLLDLELMRPPGAGRQKAFAARIMPAAATRIGNGMEPRPCTGTPAREDASYFLRGPNARMKRVQAPAFYQAVLPAGPLGQ